MSERPPSESPDPGDPHSSDSPEMLKKPERRYLAWPLPLATIWLVLPAVGVLLRLSMVPVDPYDYWWSMAMGKLIAWYADIPDQNLFLYTMPADAPFVNQPWLAQWVMFVLMEQFGHAGPIIMRNLLALLTWVGLLGAAMQRAPRPRLVGGLGLFGVALAAPVMSVRTQIFSFLPFVLLLWLIFSVAERRLRPAWLFALAPLTALWANLHGTFILAPLLLLVAGGALVVERWLKERAFSVRQVFEWSLAALAASLAAMLNPIGPKIYAYVWELTFDSTVSSTVTEWQPPTIDDFFGVLFAALAVVSLVVLFLRRKNVRLIEALLYAATFYLAVSAIRNIFWWVALLMLVLPAHIQALINLKPWWKTPTSQKQGIIHAGALGILLAATLLAQPGMFLHTTINQTLISTTRRTDPGAGLLSQNNPTRLVQGLAELGYPGRIFHSQESGGLLDYVLGTPASRSAKSQQQPTRQVAFVDQRVELIPEAIWDDYFKVSSAADEWPQILEDYRIRTLLLRADKQPRLIRAVQESPDWALVGVDEAHLLFFRADQTRYIGRWRSLDRPQHPAKHEQRAD